MITSDLFTNNSPALFENTGPVTHRIGLTVTDPNHPMVSKRKEPYQKSIRITQNVSDREAAINQAIAHYRRKGYKVHDHHYLGTVDQGMAEGSFKQTPGQQQYGALHSQLQSLANSGQINTPDGKQKAEKMIDTIQQLVDTDPSCAGSTVPSKKIWLSEQGMAEASLGDYRKKATVNKAMAQANKFFGRDDPAAVAAADRTIAKRERGLARADVRAKAYVPPQAEPADLEKQQRDLTAKYPNIDELVRRAELNRDPDYEMADGQAYYAARDAEQNYQKLRQIQRVIQGLNESLQRTQP